ncbi:hypothetical protein C4N9_20790 [Pararhodobacter marinus]|uniref:Uncharacterized protein n=1 Tax=Pararhodobacter marinus TaxID=2184063 RepID=A0A2U2C485_9RHOB|nr:hypothetical protein [Pararhodobacter marinus]PWE26700.1 hypothetical protein C4N9_20790 [Pararhodobacter marinus]
MTDDDAITIAINDVSYPILCGFCEAPIARRAEPDADREEVGCVLCGNWANAQEAGQLAVEFAKADAQLQLNRLARDATKSSSLLTFSGDTEHDRAHRFIVHFNI